MPSQKKPTKKTDFLDIHMNRLPEHCNWQLCNYLASTNQWVYMYLHALCSFLQILQYIYIVYRGTNLTIFHYICPCSSCQVSNINRTHDPTCAYLFTSHSQLLILVLVSPDLDVCSSAVIYSVQNYHSFINSILCSSGCTVQNNNNNNSNRTC